MTIKELIKELKKYKRNTNVFVDSPVGLTRNAYSDIKQVQVCQRGVVIKKGIGTMVERE